MSEKTEKNDSLEKIVRKNAIGIRELQKIIEETNRGISGIKEAQLKTDEQQLKTDDQLKKLGKQIGRFANSHGEFVEDLVAPATLKVFSKFGIRVDSIYQRAKSSKDGGNMEIDVVGVGRRENGKRIVMLVSVKSKVKADTIRELLDDINDFYDFFEDYKGREIIGVVAGIGFDKGVDKYAEREGFFVIGSSGEVVELLNSRDFVPKIFIPKSA